MERNEGLELPAVAAALPSFRLRADRAKSAISQHLDAHGGYLAWSGGRDSTAVLAAAYDVSPTVPVVWFDSGLEYPETRDYVYEIADRLSLNLHVLPAARSALDVLRESGAWDHSVTLGDASGMHDDLIAAPSRRAHEMFGIGELSGLRAEESVGRRALLAPGNGCYRRADGSVVLAPLWSWSSDDVRAMLHFAGVPENPVYAKLQRLGAPERAQRVGLVVDGNNPHHGRYTYLRNGWPDLWADLIAVLPRLNEWR